MAKQHYTGETGTVCSKQRKSKIDRAYEKARLFIAENRAIKLWELAEKVRKKV